ncbi:hypothetical protein NKG94_21145 [Micromonospora sp. M12]
MSIARAMATICWIAREYEPSGALTSRSRSRRASRARARRRTSPSGRRRGAGAHGR